MVQSDYEKIVNKIKDVGGILLQSFTNETEQYEADTDVEFWNINGNAVILLSYSTGDYGLYKFVGKNGDPVEKDIDFLESLKK